MATAAGRRLTAAYRQRQLALRAATIRDLIRLWPALDWQRLDDTYPAWARAVGLLVHRDRRTAAGLAAAYLRAFRAAEGVPGELRVVIPPDLPEGRVDVSLRATSVAPMKTAAARGISEVEARRAALVSTSGAVSRMVLDAGRDTVMGTVKADPEAQGWQRVTGAGSCSFCQMLSGRGAVYKESTVSFASHDHCACTVEPAYGGDLRPVGDYVPTTRNVTDADRARVRDYLARHHGAI